MLHMLHVYLTKNDHEQLFTLSNTLFFYCFFESKKLYMYFCYHKYHVTKFRLSEKICKNMTSKKVYYIFPQCG